MAQINNKGDLDSALSDWFGKRGDFAASNYDDDFVALCEDRIHWDLRVRAMETQYPLILKATTAITAANVAGTGDVITLANIAGETVTSQTLGETYNFTAKATNTTNVTVNVDGVGDVALNKGDGTTALEANDIVNGIGVNIYYDGTRFVQVAPGGIPLPSRYLQQRRLYIDTDNIRRLTYLTPEEFYSKKASVQSGTPRLFTVEGDQIIFGPKANAAITGRLLYYRGFARLSADGDTNWIFDNARGLYLFGSLLEASTFLNDDTAMQKYATLFSDVLSRVMAADQRDRTPAAVTARSDIPTGGGV